MRRTASPLSLVLLGLGAFLLVLAPMLAWYVEPRAKRTPIDVDQITVFKGTGSYFDTEKIKTVTGQNLTITRQVRGDVADSDKSGRAIWDVSTSVDPDKSLPAADPHDSLQWSLERWVTDRLYAGGSDGTGGLERLGRGELVVGALGAGSPGLVRLLAEDQDEAIARPALVACGAGRH